MGSALSVGRIFYGLFYGLFVAGAYFLAKVRGQSGGLELFAATSVLSFLLHLALWPKTTARGLLDPKMVIRGVLYGATQVLVLRAQAVGATSAALVASTLGNVFGILLGRLILKEKTGPIAAIAAVLCTAAAFVDPLLVLTSGWGIVGGLIQGTGFVLARALMVERKSQRQAIATGFGIGGCVALLGLWAMGQAEMLLSIKPIDLAALTAIALVVQYGFFQLYKMLDSQRASMLAMARIPWAIALQYVVLGVLVPPKQLASAAFVLSGAALLIYEATLATRLSARSQAAP